jgi:hypothetical protein
MTDSRTETSQMREDDVTYGRRRHHALDAFQTSGSSPPLPLGHLSEPAAANAAWRAPWSR